MTYEMLEKLDWDSMSRAELSQYVLDAIKTGDELPEDALKRLALEPPILVDEVEGDFHRWDREVKTVFKLEGDDRLWAIDWRNALTELQEDEFCEQPYQVTMMERKVTAILREYEPV